MSRRWRAATGTASVLVLATSCGSGASAEARAFADRPAEEVVRAALHATTDLRAVRLRGYITTAGNRIRFDLRTDRAGDCAGTMTVGPGTAAVVATAEATFLRGNEAFWRDQAGPKAAAVQELLENRWARTAPTEDLAKLCTVHRGFLDALQRAVPADLGNDGLTRVAGTDAVKVAVRSPEGGYRLYVEAESPHRVRKVVRTAQGEAAEVTLADFDDRRPVRVPGPGEYVAIS